MAERLLVSLSIFHLELKPYTDAAFRVKKCDEYGDNNVYTAKIIEAKSLLKMSKE